MKILVVEDEKDLAKALCRGLQAHGYSCDVAHDGEIALEKFFENNYEIIVLDLNLPIIDGLDVLKEIRKESKEQKVIILSARSEISDKVIGFDLGTNDYLEKPFDFLELLARVSSLSRRRFIQNDIVIEFFDLKIDTYSKNALIDNMTINLTPKEYKILEYFMLNREKVVSAEDLLNYAWDNDIDFFTDAIKVHIANLRKKLSVSSRVGIRTIRNNGYILEHIGSKE